MRGVMGVRHRRPVTAPAWKRTRRGTPRAAAVATIVLLALLAGLAGCRPGRTSPAAAPGNGQPAPGNQPRSAAAPAPVDVFGVVRSDESHSLVIEFQARVVRADVRMGTIVEPTRALLVVDASEALREIDTLDSQIRAAELRLDQRRREIERADAALVQELRSLEQEIAQRESELARTRSELSQLRSALSDGTDLDLLSRAAEVSRLESERAQAREDLRLEQRLLETGAIAPAQVDQTQRRVADLESRLSTARLELARTSRAKEERTDELTFQAEQLSSTIERLRLRLESLTPPDLMEAQIQEAQLEQLRLQRERIAARFERDYLSRNGTYLEVRSPVGTAVVSEITATPGDLISPGTRVARVESATALSVEAFVPEEFIREVSPGAAARIVTLADRARVYEGTVDHVSAAAEQRGNETVFRIRVGIHDPDDFLRPNMNVDLSIRQGG